MENSDDWCYFVKLAEIDLSMSYNENYMQSLISVNNTFGWVFLAIFNKLHIIKSEQLISYFTHRKPTSELVFTSNITQVCSDDYGNTLALGRECNLDLISFTEAIQGRSKSKSFILPVPIRKLDFFQNWLSVLLQNNTLELYQNIEKHSELPNVSAFAFIDNSKGVYFSEGSIILATIPDFNIEKQVTIDFIPYAIAKFEDNISVLGMKSNTPNLFIYNSDLKNIGEINCIDTFPFSPHQSLTDVDLESMPFVGNFYYIPTRKTLLFSSTCSVSLDLIMIDERFSIVNFEENPDGQCKIGWSDGFENVFRGLAFVNSYGPPKEDFAYTLKDSVFNIAQPPLVVGVGSNGVVFLRRFIDLRGKFLKDHLCVESKNVFNCREEVKFDVKTPSKKVEEKKLAPITAGSESKQKGLVSEEITGNKLAEAKISGLNLSSVSLSSENKNPFLTPSQKNPDMNTKPPAPEPKTKPPTDNLSPQKNSFFLSDPSKSESKPLSTPLIKPGENAFFLNTTPKAEEKKLNAPLVTPETNPFKTFQPKAEEKKLSTPLVSPETNPFKSFQLKTDEQKLNTSSSKPDSILTTNNQPKIEEEEKKKLFKPETSFLTSNQPKTDNIKPNNLFIKPGENNFFMQNQAKPEDKKLLGTLKQPEPGKSNLILNPEPVAKDLNPAPVKPPEKPATISWKLMNEMNEITKSIFEDMKSKFNNLDMKKISEVGLKTRETSILSLKPRIKKLSENYIKAKDSVNSLARNLDEFSLDIEDIRKVVDEDQTKDIDDSHIGLNKTIKENERNLNVSKIYDDSMTRMINYMKGIKQDLGFKVDNIGTISRFIKTRAYIPPQEEKVRIIEEVLRKVIIEKTNQAFKKLEDLKNKSKGLNKSTGRYSFNF